MRVAIVEDDPLQRELVERVLVDAGFKTHSFRTGRDFLREFARESFDLLVVDWRLPDVPGIEIVRAVRARPNAPVGIMFATVRDEEADVIEAFEAGADDYMTKPVRTGELIVRLRALARRATTVNSTSDIWEFDRFRFDTARSQAWNRDQPVALTSKEFQLGMLLLRNVGRPLSRGHLRESVWGNGSDLPTRTLDTHVSRVRSKLGLRPDEGYLLAPVYSYGYRLERLGDEAEARQVADTPLADEPVLPSV
ncbi:MAG: response regulator transcription factor [Burkholderiaceae bacterium]|nr:response regulator transcription factor [Burkholderiaceae bacterium]